MSLSTKTAEEYKVPIKPNRGWAGLPAMAKNMYKGRYFQPEEDYELWLDRVCRAYSDNREHRGRMKQYFRNYWFHSATPVSVNAGLSKQGLPVSCFVTEVEDSKDGIFSNWEEGFYLGSKGAGIGSYWGNVREAGAAVGTNGKSSGVVPFLKVSESMTLAVSQGGIRRASQAVYLRVSHPEIEEFVMLKDPSGDPARRTPQLFTAVIIDDKFIEAVEKREKYALISPKTKEVVREVDAFDLFHKILEQRMIKGVPYIMFEDNANRQRVVEYVKENFDVKTSNLCLEVYLHTAPDYSNICVLSSINLEYFDEFTETPELFSQFIEDTHRFLDNVLQSFIDNAKGQRGFEKSVRAAEYERSIGIGTMGFHYYLQKKGIPFESIAAKGLNDRIFQMISGELEVSNKKLAEEKGANPLSAKYGIMRRNSHTMAIAPTASISILCNQTSSGIEPLVANVYVHKTNQGTELVKNRHLKQLLAEKDKDTDDVWYDILANEGSVQHLDFLTDYEKEVFKTAFEINQQVIIDFAGGRQKYINQGQSVNLFIKPNVDFDYLYSLHMFAWVVGVKGLYYIRSDAPKKVGKLDFKSANELVDKMMEEDVNKQKFEECMWCQ